MKRRFRVYRRKKGGHFYIHDSLTGKQESLATRDRAEAFSLLLAKNELIRQPALNLREKRGLGKPHHQLYPDQDRFDALQPR